MSKILSFLSNIKLTAYQWTMGSLAAIAAGLVVALKLQGSKLHSVQVELLRATYGATMTQQDAKVEGARKKFLDALAAYGDANDHK